MDLLKVLGVVAGVALAGAAVYAAVKITREYLRKKGREVAERRGVVDEAFCLKVEEKFQSGEYSNIRCGLYDENYEQIGHDFTISAKGELEDDIEEGEIIELAA